MAFFKHVFKQNDRAVTGTHSDLVTVFVEQRNHTVRDVNEIFRPRFTHEFEHLENLSEMKILLIRHDVKALIEIIMLLTITSRGKISRSVKRRAVRAQYNTRRHSVFFEIHDLRTLARFKQSFFFEFVDNGLHFIVIKTLAGIRIESYIEFFIDLFDFFKREFLKLIEKSDAFFVAVFDKFEITSRFVVHFGVFFALFMVFHVKTGKFFYSALFDVFFIAPMLIRVNEFAKLRTVVAEMVYSDGIISQKLIQTV